MCDLCGNGASGGGGGYRECESGLKPSNAQKADAGSDEGCDAEWWSAAAVPFTYYIRALLFYHLKKGRVKNEKAFFCVLRLCMFLKISVFAWFACVSVRQHVGAMSVCSRVCARLCVCA